MALILLFETFNNNNNNNNNNSNSNNNIIKLTGLGH